MERLRCVQQSHGSLVRLISMATLQRSGSFTQIIAGWLGHRFPSYPEEDFLVEDSSSVFDACFQDGTAFHPDAESHLEWGFELKDSAFSDPEPSTNSWDSVLDDSNLIGELRAECRGPLDKDIVLEDDELVAALFTSSFLSRPVRETLRVP